MSWYNGGKEVGGLAEVVAKFVKDVNEIANEVEDGESCGMCGKAVPNYLCSCILTTSCPNLLLA